MSTLNFKKSILSLLAIALTVSTVWTLSIYIPKFKNWVSLTVSSESKKHLPISLQIKSIDINLFPIGLSFNNVAMVPDKELSKTISATTISKINLSLSFWSLFKGQLKVGNVDLYGADLKLNLDTLLSSQKNSSTPALKWSQLKMIPIDRIRLKNISAQARYQKEIHQLHNLAANLDLDWRSLFVTLSAENLTSSFTGNTPVSLQLKSFISKKGVKIHSLQAKHKSSFVAVSGSIIGDPLLKQPFGKNIKIRTQINLEEAAHIARRIKTLDLHLKASGTLYSDLHIQQSKTQKKPTVDFNVRSSDAALQTESDQFQIGNISTVGTFKNETFNFPKIELNHPSGKGQINEVELRLGKKITVRGEVVVKSVELKKFLNSLDIQNVPLKIIGQGEMPCYGELYPNTSVHCKGFVRVPLLHVWADKPSDTIVKGEHLQAIGHLDITAQDIKYKAKLRMRDATGSSHGSVTFRNGFKAYYEGHFPDVQQITSLADLRMEGEAWVKGSTSGNSNIGIIDMNLKTKKFWFENYYTGSGQAKVAYRSGNLFFRRIKGRNGVSKYKGNLRLNLLKNKIYADIQAPFVEIKDVLKSIKREIPLPVTASGTGFAKVKLWGPLQLNKLSMNFESSFFRGRIDKENYDECYARLEAVKGRLKSKKITLKKLNSIIDVQGEVSPKGFLDAKIKGKGLRLEQSEYIKELGLNAEGNLDFSMLLKGEFLEPDTTLKGRISELVMGEKKMQNSQFQLTLRKNSIEGKANLIGKTIQTQFTIPFNNTDPFSLYVKSRNWNFIHLFDLFSENALKLGFNTNLDGEIKLEAPTGGFWKSSGFVSINNFLINRGDEFLRSTGTARAIFKNGRISTENFELKGLDSFINLKAKNAHRDNLNFKLNGKLKLNLLALFTPFLRELQGDLSVGMKFSGSPENFSMVGSTYIQNGTIALEAFPQPFEELSADLLFGPKNILINSLKTKFGKGPLSAEGEINFKSLEEILIRLDGQFRNVAMNVPEGFKTKGSGTFSITGDQVPYRLKIGYDVEYGDIEKDLSQISGEDENIIKPGTFLPKFLTKSNFQPISLDVNVTINKPVNVHILVARMDIRTPVIGKLRAQGTPDDIHLDGRISSVPEGEIIFNSNEFDIQTGVVTYRNAPPESPELNVQAESRISTSTDGEEYDVNLLVLGTASQPKVNLQSQPPLSEQEILSLLALGTLSEESQLSQGSNPRDDQSKYKIDSKIIADQLGISREIKEKLGIDFDLSSSYNGDESTTHRLTVRKNFSRNFGIEASRTIEKNPKNEFRAEYRLNPNVSLTGNYNSRQSTGAAEALASEDQEVLGVDIEYKVKFK